MDTSVRPSGGRDRGPTGCTKLSVPGTSRLERSKKLPAQRYQSLARSRSKRGTRQRELTAATQASGRSVRPPYVPALVFARPAAPSCRARYAAGDRDRAPQITPACADVRGANPSPHTLHATQRRLTSPPALTAPPAAASWLQRASCQARPAFQQVRRGRKRNWSLTRARGKCGRSSASQPASVLHTRGCIVAAWARGTI